MYSNRHFARVKWFDFEGNIYFANQFNLALFMGWPVGEIVLTNAVRIDDCRIVLDGRAASDRSDYVFSSKQPTFFTAKTMLKFFQLDERPDRSPSIR